MPLLTAAEVQARGVGVDMDAGDLQDLIDAEEALMIAKWRRARRRRKQRHGDRPPHAEWRV